MSKKPIDLPNIEDATLRACLAPLMEAVAVSSVTTTSSAVDVAPSVDVTPFPRDYARPVPNRQPLPAPTNDVLPPPPRGASRGFTRTPDTLAEWQAVAGQEFAAFGTVAQLLARSDAELLAAAGEFPQQLQGTLTRLTAVDNRLALQRYAVTTLMVRLRMAMTRAAVDAGAAVSFTDRAKHRPNPGR
jgi:hypothetical protein